MGELQEMGEMMKEDDIPKALTLAAQHTSLKVALFHLTDLNIARDFKPLFISEPVGGTKARIAVPSDLARDLITAMFARVEAEAAAIGLELNP
jgi:hypothetical protein